MEPTVDIYLDGEGVRGGVRGGAAHRLVGRARFALRRGQITTSFSYSDAFLASPDAFAIDPHMPITKAAHFFAGLPGALADTAPDRWGRRLIRRGWTRTPDEVDYMLGTSDLARQGALRYRVPGEDESRSGGRLGPEGSAGPTGSAGKACLTNGSIPPLVQLPRLLAACRAVLADPEAHDEVKYLLSVGSSTLGGARPKASVLDEGVLYIAKFPAPSDGHDVMAWEKTAVDLASSCGIETPTTRLVRIGDDGVLLLRRFDRRFDRDRVDAGSGEGGGDGKGSGIGSICGTRRLPYISAMTLLGGHDGDVRDYVEIAEGLSGFVKDPGRDLGQLFRRIAFSIAANNTDDHLRNHGFLRVGAQWRLSPAFDVNPNPDAGAPRATSILGETGVGQARALREAAPEFGLSAEQAKSIVAAVMRAMGSWRLAARRNRCREAEIHMFEPVFAQRAVELRDAFGL